LYRRIPLEFYEMSDEFNPFAVTNTRTQVPRTENSNPYTTPVSSEPAILPTYVPPQPAADTRVSVADLEKRQRELDAKARDIERREQEQTERLRQQSQSTTSNGKNWPPLPNCCPMRPCFRQYFETDFQPGQRTLIKRIYYAWLLHFIVWFLNIWGTLAYFIGSAGDTRRYAGISFGSSILFFILMVPLSLYFWYRRAYQALKNDSSINYFVFFIISIVMIGICFVQCLGVDSLPSCGWINAFVVINTDLGVGITMIVIAILFTLLGIVDVILLILVLRFYRSSGASLDKAKQELGKEVASEAINSLVSGSSSVR
jgi:secretory carrier-associated membrane protein